MRILVHEHASLNAERVPLSLLREGVAMRDALIEDLVAAGHHVTMDGNAQADGVWLIAPETDGVHERIARRMRSNGFALFGSTPTAIRRAADKAALARLLRRSGIPHPETTVIRDAADAARKARAIGYPVIVKPVRGAGCEGVRIIDGPPEGGRYVRSVRLQPDPAPRFPLLLQKYIPGVAASVSLIADGTRAVPLALNAQRVRRCAGALRYEGGRTPLDHPLAARALRTAARTCEALPGLRGFVGVDMVLTAAEAFVIEVNPRLTTAYLGVRAALGVNVAALALAACQGSLPDAVMATRRVRFVPSGRVVAA